MTVFEAVHRGCATGPFPVHNRRASFTGPGWARGETRPRRESVSMVPAADFENSSGAFVLARRAALPVLFCVGALAVWTSVVFVSESEFVLVETLGRIAAVYDRTDPADSDRGLHFKLPWPIATVRRFDRRLQLFGPADVSPEPSDDFREDDERQGTTARPGMAAREVFTRDKKNITVNCYLAWKIADPADRNIPILERPVVKFFRGLGTVETAEARIEARMRSALEIEIGRVELADLLRVESLDGVPAGESPLARIARQALAELKRQEGGELFSDRLGIELIDLRIQRINLPEGNRVAVYERMRTERQRFADQYRSSGLAEKARIESQARRQSEELLARADAKAEGIRGEGEAEAIRILSRAQAGAPDFYEFVRTLETYTKILGERTTIVLSTGSRLFKLLIEGVPDATGKSETPKQESHPTPEAAAEEGASSGAPKRLSD